MAWIIPLSTSTTALYAVDAGERDVLIAQQVVVASSSEDGYGILQYGAPDRQAVVHGSAIGWGGLYVYETASYNLLVGATGHITGFNANGVRLDSSTVTFENRGVIETLGSNYAAVGVSSNSPSGTFTAVNSGLIEGDYGVYFNNYATTSFLNTGTIDAPVMAFMDETGSADTLTNRGVIIGDVNLGGGADLFDGRAGTLVGEIIGGAGADTIMAGTAADTIRGGADHDRILGGGGADTLFGEAGNDVLFGGAGADRLDGGSGIDLARYDDAYFGNLVIRLDAPQANTGAAAGDTYVGIEGIVAGTGNDTVFGDAAGNRLYGMGGNDTIDGRGGADYFEGGAGADTFRFSTALGAGNIDAIADFQRGVDHIALHGAIFTGIGPTLTASEFGSAPAAGRLIIYQQSTGALFYDQGGAGIGAGPRHFASVTPGTVLDVGDFVMV